MTAYVYRPDVLAALLAFGIRPRAHTPPGLAREQVNDLYRYELRRLRGRLLRGEIARPRYAGHVIDLRRRYALLSVPVDAWATTDG